MVTGRDETLGRRIRLGMVGGGNDAFIGGVHRIAARIDDRFELVAGALSSTPEKSRESGEALGLPRVYEDFKQMLSMLEDNNIDIAHNDCLYMEKSS